MRNLYFALQLQLLALVPCLACFEIHKMDVKSKGIPKKIGSKQKRAIKYISAETNIVLGLEPTKNIVICNAGLALRLSQEDVIRTFSTYGTIESVVMMPDKTYCFMAFFDKADAVSAYGSLHGKCFFPRTENLMVLAFATQVPQIPNVWAALPRETPPGMIVLEEFVTLEEEKALVALLKWDDKGAGQLKQRQVQHFGYAFRYGLNDVDDEMPLESGIPPFCDFLQPRLAQHGHAKWNFHPDQLTVNRYLPGQGIPPHVDTHSVFEDPIISLSLLSDVVMEFRDIFGKKVPVLLPQRSLAIISGESRYGWTHGIASRTHDIVCADNNKGLTLQPRQERISFTFRSLRSKRECFCSFPGLCDSQKQNLFSQQLDAIHLEKHFVRQVYEEISDHFSETRHTPWPNIVEFCKTFRTGQILIDVGCGNGKYFGQQAENVSLYQLGIDASTHLADVCIQRGIEVMNGDCVNLPYRSGIADGVLCIAVIHHLASHERRRRAIQEIARVLCKGGRALVYVWARDQQTQDKMSTYLKQNRKNRHLSPALPKTQDDWQNSSNLVGDSSGTESEDHRSDLPLPVHLNRTNFKHSDVLVPWKLKGACKPKDSVNNKQTFFRYYHVFEADELKELCSEVPQVEVLETKYDQGNWSVLLKKLL